MEYSEWHDHGDKPDLNGIYQRRDLSEPDVPNKYSLYRNGWHVECDTIKEAYYSIEKHRGPSLNYEMKGTTKSLKIGGNMIAKNLQWRGLAEKTTGMKYESSDKWSKR